MSSNIVAMVMLAGSVQLILGLVEGSWVLIYCMRINRQAKLFESILLRKANYQSKNRVKSTDVLCNIITDTNVIMNIGSCKNDLRNQ